MARENQGLQIALIIFFMLTIVFGVMTFIFFKQYEEAEKKAAAAQTKAAADSAAVRTKTEECGKLMKLLGFEASEKLDAVEARFAEDMQNYGGASYPEENRDYHNLLDFLYKALQKKNAELIEVGEGLAAIEAKYKDLVAQELKQKQEAEVAAAAAKKHANTVDTTAATERERMEQENQAYTANLALHRTTSQEKLSQINATLEGAQGKIAARDLRLEKLVEKLDGLTKETIETPDGEIRWVDQHNRTVWIDLGRADGLTRQITFAVYPMDTSNLTTAGSKAKIEVTQIYGEHRAEARVLEDTLTDPIMIGDKIHTPLWSPGERKRFALAGFMDIDEDGRSDREIVMNLIRMNGGSVDCWISDEGELKGSMNENIRYVVRGETAGKDDDDPTVDAYSKIMSDAKEFGTQQISLWDLLQQMGWRNQTPVVRFGRNANPKDFRAKPPEGVPKVSTGTVSDLFRPRRPPNNSGRGGAY